TSEEPNSQNKMVYSDPRKVYSWVNPDFVCPGSAGKPRSHLREDPRSGEARRADHLHGGAVPLAVFLPGRRCAAVRSGGDDSRAINRADAAAGERAGRSDCGVIVRKARDRV